MGPKTAPFITVSPTAQQRAQSPNPGRTMTTSDSQSSLLSLKSVSSPYVQRPKAVHYSGHIEPPLPDSIADRAKGARPSEKRDLPGLSTLKSHIKTKPFQSASKNNTVYGGSLRRPYTGPSLYVKVQDSLVCVCRWRLFFHFSLFTLFLAGCISRGCCH